MIWAMVSFPCFLARTCIWPQRYGLDPWLLRLPWHSPLCVDHIQQVDIWLVHWECVSIQNPSKQLFMLLSTSRLQSRICSSCYELRRTIPHGLTNSHFLDGRCNARPPQVLGMCSLNKAVSMLLSAHPRWRVRRSDVLPHHLCCELLRILFQYCIHFVFSLIQSA